MLVAKDGRGGTPFGLGNDVGMELDRPILWMEEDKCRSYPEWRFENMESPFHAWPGDIGAERIRSSMVVYER